MCGVHCQHFHAFTEIDIDHISKQTAELFNVDAVGMEVINLQNHIQMKPQQHSQHFRSLVDPENDKNLHRLPSKHLLYLDLQSFVKQRFLI